MLRVILPSHLRVLANITSGEIRLDLPAGAAPTQRALLDALEERYPNLKGTLRDHGSTKRRPMIRFFACEEDLSNEPPDAPLPPRVASGEEPFVIIGAIAGG